MPAESNPPPSPPPLLRPVPRRPFALSLTSATPPDDESPPPTPPAFLSPRHLEPLFQQQNNSNGSPGNNGSPAAFPESGGASGSLSRAQSIRNLTASTLFGIYGPTASNGRGGYTSSFFGDEPSTPCGPGAETPSKLRGPVSDEDGEEYDQQRAAAVERLRERLGSARAQQLAATASVLATVPSPSSASLAHTQQPRPASVLSLATRATLLFVLGIAYGAVVSKLQDERGRASSFHSDSIGAGGQHYQPRSAFGRIHAAFWGTAGVVLGSLLPWFDIVWDQTFGREGSPPPVPLGSSSQGLAGDGIKSRTAAQKPKTDWALVIRGAGAFAGIVFAIRKLPWASTMQASVALALVNPFLWYLIDRSKSGFLLASAVGVIGSAVIMSLDPEMMPAPATAGSSAVGCTASGCHNGSIDAVGHPAGPSRTLLGGLATQATVEAGIWMLSVLFCSCVCFGNIGRRLAIDTSAPVRGRWGGLR